MKKSYDWNQRPLGAPLPRGGNFRRGGPPRRKQEAPPPDRTAIRVIVACLVTAVAISVVAALVLRGSAGDPGVTRAPDSWDWTAEEYVVPEDMFEPPPAPPPAETVAAPTRPARPEPPPAAEESPAAPASPKVAARAKKAPPAAPEAAAPEVPKSAGENRLFTLSLSGTLGGENLDPEDGQTWARLSYFLREEARRPHFLVYPDGSIPVSVPAAVDGKPAPASRIVDVPGPDGDTDQPAYRLVVEASAGEGSGVTFYRQRLASTYRSRVSCRIDRWTGDAWRLFRHVLADESINLSKDSTADPATCVRQVYDASIEKLLRQLAGQPPFATAPTTASSR